MVLSFFKIPELLIADGGPAETGDLAAAALAIAFGAILFVATTWRHA